MKTLQEGDGSVNLSLFPAGTCALCCPIELDRDVEYQLYTRRNPLRPQILKPSNPWSLKRSNFDKNVPTVVYIHGYGERAPGRSSMAIRDAYLRRGRYNIILVDWGKLSALPWYITAVGNSRSVGPHVGKMVRWLEYHGAVPMSKLHVIGFSLGAEVAGFMGKSLAPRKVARITGLDAAYPLYMNTGSKGHLAASDATFVDVIHTDGGVFGFLRPLGHADFYPNGGRPLQPGCTLDTLISMGVTRLLNQYIVCGHNRAWRFYAESVTNPHGFPASRCWKWPPDSRASCTWSPVALMGLSTDPRLRGIFYLRTNARPPFSRNFSDYPNTKLSFVY
ncbi:pancreatic lipase-related protein 2 isoform X2 [Venturia canescens]|uniref:pancreatic lipase-related protein 2 isoform X2 n=1 Tax=Venturia canescens TaxID=32260 RepID=UPI001C9C889E|nr:pancreatic lipase-related protein 2 isoform X2 [Venturia canescens]